MTLHHQAMMPPNGLPIFLLAGRLVALLSCFENQLQIKCMCHIDVSRITAIVLDTDMGPLLLANVYMPTNYGDSESLELYVDCLSRLHALIIDTNTAHVIIAGDFNY